MMLLTIDNLAHRYNCLPSEALARATTFDLHVLDLSAKWRNHQTDVANGVETDKSNHNLTQEEMLDMLKRARGK